MRFLRGSSTLRLLHPSAGPPERPRTQPGSLRGRVPAISVGVHLLYSRKRHKPHGRPVPFALEIRASPFVNEGRYTMEHSLNGGGSHPTVPLWQRPWLDAYPRGVPPSLSYPSMPISALLETAAHRFPHRPV